MSFKYTHKTQGKSSNALVLYITPYLPHSEDLAVVPSWADLAQILLLCYEPLGVNNSSTLGGLVGKQGVELI